MFYSSHMPTRLGQQSWYIRFLRQKGSSTGSKKKQLFGAWKVVFFPERMNPFFAFTPGKNNSPSAHVARIAVSMAWSGLLKKQLFGAWKVDFFRAPSAPLWCSKETLWPRFFTRFLGAARRCFLRAWWACCLDQGMCEKVLLQRASLDRSHQLLPKRWCCSPKNSKSSNKRTNYKGKPAKPEHARLLSSCSSGFAAPEPGLMVSTILDEMSPPKRSKT